MSGSSHWAAISPRLNVPTRDCARCRGRRHSERRRRRMAGTCRSTFPEIWRRVRSAAVFSFVLCVRAPRDVVDRGVVGCRAQLPVRCRLAACRRVRCASRWLMGTARVVLGRRPHRQAFDRADAGVDRAGDRLCGFGRPPPPMSAGCARSIRMPSSNARRSASGRSPTALADIGTARLRAGKSATRLPIWSPLGASTRRSKTRRTAFESVNDHLFRSARARS